MKKALFALLLLVGAAAMMATTAFANDEGERVPIHGALRSLAVKSNGMRTSATTPSDTLYFGHSHTNHTGAGNNPDNLWTGNYLPTAAANPNFACWDFENQTGLAHLDSLQGWWPMRIAYRYTASGLTDKQHSWWALDHGNQANYVLPDPNRPRGVVGVWHSDPGSNTDPQGLMQWAPIAGAGSAWCGLRGLGDNTVVDPITSVPFNQMVMEFNDVGFNTNAAGTYRNFPGYANQWDQMLYRDVTPTASQPLDVSFTYRTLMSTDKDLTSTTRTGWFDGDPLKVAAGNFISSNDAGTNAPVDSFMVYLGVPVDESNCYYSDGTADAVYDLQRRWFDEVLQRFSPLGVSNPPPPMIELLAVAGGDGTNQSFSTSVPAATWGPVASYSYNPYPGKVRLAFRVKTNRGWADQDYIGGGGETGNGFTSNTYGAAQIDNVLLTDGSLTLLSSGFNAESEIDNDTATLASAAWKSTGKPVMAYFHPINVATVASTWKDLCGVEDSPNRTCNMDGIVIDAGNADASDALCDPRYTALQEAQYGMIGPTIDLTSVVGGNSQGLLPNRVDPTDDYYLWYDIYQGALRGSGAGATGAFWDFGVMDYPCAQFNGLPVWSDLILFSYILSDGATHCYQDWEQLKANSMFFTSNGTGVPDSMRIFLGIVQRCFRYGISVGCNSTAGCYFDNVSIGFANAQNPSELGSISTDIWQWYHDAFPVNGITGTDNVSPSSAAFDTTTAYVKGVLNNYPNTNNAFRFDVMADTIAVQAQNGTGADPRVRVDMIFRILPGPGNYQIAAGRSFPPIQTMQLLQVPTNQAGVVAPNDGEFWGAYIGDQGEKASVVNNGNHHNHTWWDYLTWNSARCDTAEINMFMVSGKSGNGLNVNGVVYSSTYHESDPKFPILGILKNKCFLKDTTLSAVDSNIVCDGVTIPTWLSSVPPSRTGWDNQLTTKEYTKIIPDGLLTPGSHVQYFFRKQAADSTGGFVMVPDTTLIQYQGDESNYDGHRWQQFSVLPDKWKSGAFTAGSSMACMLYVDNNDRRGDEYWWTAIMDSIGGTASAKWGAHNGWHSAGGFDLSNSNPSLSTAFVYGKNQQPGSTWDMYGVKASESGTTGGGRLGNRLAYHPYGSMGTAEGKQAAIGPKANMLREFYHIIAWLSGDLNTTLLGPNTNISEDDIGLLTNFLTDGTSGTALPRGLFVQGDGFVETEQAAGGVHSTFLSTKLGATLRNKDYSTLVGSLYSCVDLVNTAPISTGDIYAVVNTCNATLDVYNTPTLTGASAVGWYQNLGSNGPYIASIYHQSNGTDTWISLIDGWDIYHTQGRYCVNDHGRLAYYYKVMTSVFGSLCTTWGSPATTLNVPGNEHGGQYANFMKIGNSVMRSGNATVNFGVANSGRVRVRLYDVTGRLVRSLVDKTYVADGTMQKATWDGRDDAGNQVARGVYFARIDYANGGAINGRVVVLR